jgi:hypothetical protein
MKSAMMIAIVLLLCLGGSVRAQQAALMAWYPLNGTANDSTGQYGPMLLENTPFASGGGILCSGIYRNSGKPGWCDAETPAMPITIFRAFGLAVQFKVDSLPTRNSPVFIGGKDYRWMGIDVRPNGTMYLRTNSSGVTSALACAPGIWHEAVMTYDSAAAEGKLYLDGVLACTASFTIEHGVGAFDRTFGITNYASGDAFRGTVKNVRIYSSPDMPLGAGDAPGARPAEAPALRNHPDPFAARTVFEFSLPEAGNATLTVYDLLGHEVARVLDARRAAGWHSVSWDCGRLPSGLYLARLQTGGGEVAKLVCVRR